MSAWGFVHPLDGLSQPLRSTGRRWSVSIEYGKPYSGLRGADPFDPVPAMGWYGHTIAGLQMKRLGVSLEQQHCLALQDDHPLTLHLIVPEASGTGVIR